MEVTDLLVSLADGSIMVTGDTEDLLVLGSYRRVKIIRPAAFLKALG